MPKATGQDVDPGTGSSVDTLPSWSSGSPLRWLPFPSLVHGQKHAIRSPATALPGTIERNSSPTASTRRKCSMAISLWHRNSGPNCYLHDTLPCATRRDSGQRIHWLSTTQQPYLSSRLSYTLRVFAVRYLFSEHISTLFCIKKCRIPYPALPSRSQIHGLERGPMKPEFQGVLGRKEDFHGA